jgi:hypothetical protein
VPLAWFDWLASADEAARQDFRPGQHRASSQPRLTHRSSAASISAGEAAVVTMPV